MVATTFAADTPLFVTELVAKDGIAGNWLWWSTAFGGVLTVFFFADLWAKSGVLTDVELCEMRYDGPAAAVLRGIKAVYFGIFMNCLVCGWVSLVSARIFNALIHYIPYTISFFLAGDGVGGTNAFARSWHPGDRFCGNLDVHHCRVQYDGWTDGCNYH